MEEVNPVDIVSTPLSDRKVHSNHVRKRIREGKFDDLGYREHIWQLLDLEELVLGIARPSC